MLFRELKSTSLFRNAVDYVIRINDKDEIDDMYYQEELDHLPVEVTSVVGCNCLYIDITCSNWDKRYEPGWVAEP